MVKHVALDIDGKISGKKWSADHLEINITGLIVRTFLLNFPDGKSYTPGDTDHHDIDSSKTRLAANHLQPAFWRLTCYVGGSETTVENKSIRVSNAQSFISVLWTASGNDLRVSSWTAWDSSLEDQILTVSYKAGSVTETLTLYNIGVEFRYG